MAEARTIRVVNAYPLSPTQERRLEQAAPGIELVSRPMPQKDDVDALSDARAEVLLADFVPSDRSRVPALRWLQYSGAGVDGLLGALAPDDDLVLTTASGANAQPLGEYVLAAILDVAQHGAARREHQRKRTWPTGAEFKALFGQPLRGATLGLVGYGSIGREVARLATAFGMRVLAAKARPEVRRDDGWCVPGTGDPEGVLPQALVGTDELLSVVGEADYVVVSAPLTPQTRGRLGSAVLAAMPASAWLVNVGRGGLFDEAELIEHLAAGRIAGATLDVFVEEPLPADSLLWTLPNVVLTPHLAGGMPGVWEPMSVLFAENLRRYAAGEPLLNAVARDRQY